MTCYRCVRKEVFKSNCIIIAPASLFAAMFPRPLLAAALAAVYIQEVCCTISSTEIRPTRTFRDTNSGLDFWGRRRARDIQIQQTTPPPLQTTSPPLGPYFANYSLIGQEVECTDTAKRCLAINRLLHEPSGMCYELGDRRPCNSNGSTLILDAESFRRGQLRSRCSEPTSCKAYEMAYDGNCYQSWEVIGKFCGGSEEILFHPLGGRECDVPKESIKSAEEIRQPKSPGRCVVPNLQNNDIGPFWVKFSTAEEECLNQKLLSFRGSCHSPLSNTACPEGEWLVLDEEAAESGRLSAKCNSSQPCGSDALLLRADRSCHDNRELKDELCNGSYIFPLPTGDYVCTLSGEQYEIFVLKNGNGLNELLVSSRFSESASGAIEAGGMNCVLNDQNVCQPVVNPPDSKPDVSPEE